MRESLPPGPPPPGGPSPSTSDLVRHLTPQTAALAQELSTLALAGGAAADGAAPAGAPLSLVLKKVAIMYTKVLAPEGTPPLPPDAGPDRLPPPSPSSPRAGRFARAGGLPVVLTALRACADAGADDESAASAGWSVGVARGARLLHAAAAAPGTWKGASMEARVDAVCVPAELLERAVAKSPAAAPVLELVDLLAFLTARDPSAGRVLASHGGLPPLAAVLAARAAPPPARASAAAAAAAVLASLPRPTASEDGAVGGDADAWPPGGAAPLARAAVAALTAFADGGPAALPAPGPRAALDVLAGLALRGPPAAGAAARAAVDGGPARRDLPSLVAAAATPPDPDLEDAAADVCDALDALDAADGGGGGGDALSGLLAGLSACADPVRAWFGG